MGTTATVTMTPQQQVAATAAAAIAAQAPVTQQSFDAAYLNSLPPDVRALFAGTLGEPGTELDPATRMAQALALAKAGETIDVVIDAWGWDPYITYLERTNYGYTWVPSALMQPIPLPPGLSFPGLPTYDPNNPPVGAILISMNLPAPYKPPVPPPTPTPPADNVVGPLAYGNIYYEGPGAKGYTNGQQYTDPATGLVYTYHTFQNTPIGAGGYFSQP